MTSEFPIVKAHLADQRIVRRRRGRPRRCDNGLVRLEVLLPGSIVNALEMLSSYEQPVPHMAKFSRLTSAAQEWMRDAVEQAVCDHFEERFMVAPGRFLELLRAALDAGAHPDFAVARVLADLRADRSVQ